MAKQVTFLKVYRSNEVVDTRQFSSDQISIGSGAEGPSLVLSDPSVNYWHALIEKRGVQYYISDLGSPTGTFVNNQQVLESVIEHGDQIKIGDFLIHFYIGVPFLKPVSKQSLKSKPQLIKAKEPPAKVEEPPVKVEAPPAKVDKPAPPQKTSKTKLKQNAEADPVLSPLKQTEVIPAPPDFESIKKAIKETSEQKSEPKKDNLAQSSPPTSQPVFDDQPSYDESQSRSVDLDQSLRQSLNQKGTYAPLSEVKNLDQTLQLGSGPIVEVLVAWKERILVIRHFEKHKNQEITFGSDSECDICFPNLIGTQKYPLINIQNKVVVRVAGRVSAKVISKKGEHSFSDLMQSGLVVDQRTHKDLIVQTNQIVRLDFSSALRVYIRYVSQANKASLAPVFDFSPSETMGIMMSVVFMFFLMVYLTIFSVDFLNPEDRLETAEIKQATIKFKKRFRPVRLKMAKKKQAFSIPSRKKQIQKKIKKFGFKKPGKSGRIGSVAPPQLKSKKKTPPKVASARPGGSVKTGKKGARPKSARPDPTKLGLLGVFGSKGTQKMLDKAYSGTGELAGLAETATGYAGQKDSYTGEGIGTKFKEVGSKGSGNALIGISSNIRTKGRGGGSKGYGTGGSLGERGRVQLALGVEDWEVEGGISKQAVLRVIRRNKYQLESCYGSVLQKTPDIQGKMWFEWVIVDGRVRDIKVNSNTTGSRMLARCFMTRLKRFRFDGVGLQPGQEGVVRFPFVPTIK